MENLLKDIEILRERLQKTWGLLDIDRQKAKIKSQKTKLNDPDFWQNREEAVKINKDLSEREGEVNKWEELKKEIKDLEELVAVGQKEKDISIAEDARKKYEELLAEYEKLEFIVLFSSPYDNSSAILSIHAGTGGVDAQDWAQI